MKTNSFSLIPDSVAPPKVCRRTEPYSMRIDYRRAGNLGATVAQAAIIRRVLANGHKIETTDGRPIKEARSVAGKLQVRTADGLWIEDRPYFIHPV